MGRETKVCGVVEWGRIGYAQASAWQAELVVLRKTQEIPDLLILCEHPHVITLGRNARREHLRLAESELARRGVELHATNRGGDVTYHGPGQLVGYPILDLGGIRKDVVWYVRTLEEVLIRAARDFGIEAGRKTAPAGPVPNPEASGRDGAGKRALYTGAWVGEEKLAAIGVHLSRWVTSHGFAFNVTTDLSYFDLIVPCGIPDKRPTSLARLRPELLEQGPVARAERVGQGLVPCRGKAQDRSAQRLLPLGPTGRSPWAEPSAGTELMEAVKRSVIHHFGDMFDRTMKRIEAEEWEAWLGAHQAAAS